MQIFVIEISFVLPPPLYVGVMGCGAGLGFVCFVVVNPRVM